MVMATQLYKCIKTLQTVQLKYVNFIVYKSYIIKAVFLKRQRDTYPPLAYRKTVGIKQNGPVKHFKGMLVLSCKCFLCRLQVNSIVIYEPPTRRPGLKVAREELGEKGMTKIHGKKIWWGRQIIVKRFRGGYWKCPLSSTESLHVREPSCQGRL